MSDCLWPHGLQHTMVPCPLPTPRACSNSCPSSQWCHPTISSSVIPFSFYLQSFPASRSFPISQFSALGWRKAMAPHSSTLAWKTPWMGEPGRLQSMGSQRIWHNWGTSISIFNFMHWRKMATSSSVFAWRIPRTREPGGLLTMGSHRVIHDWSDLGIR